MNKTAVIQVRVTPVLRNEAQKYFDSIGLDLANAIRMFLTQSVQRAKGTAPLSTQRHRQQWPDLKHLTYGQSIALHKAQTEALNEISPWEDSRSTQEIIDDIISSRTIGREVVL